MMMNQDKRKIVMLYPATSKDLTLEIGVVCVGVLLPLIIGLDTLSDISSNGVDTALRLAMVLLFFGGAALAGILYWRVFAAREFLRLDTERGVLLHGRWRWGWQAQREYPLSMFAAVAAEKVRDDYRGYYGRLWLESANGQNDLVLEENFQSHKDSLQGLDDIQSHIARTTGLAKRPVINTEIRAQEETAANPAQLQPLQVKTLPAWRQAVNLAAAGLWTWLAVRLLRLAADWHSGSLPKPLYFGAGLLALGLLAVAVSEVRGVFRARRGRKTAQTQTAWRQPSEIKAALAAARQAEHEPQPKLPERAVPKLADGAEFAVYSVGTLLSRLMFLLFAFGMVWIGGGVGWRLFWLVALLSIAGRLAHRWHTLRKVRYSVLGDELIVYRLHSFKWLPEKRYALSEFCGIYSRVRCNGVSVDLSEIWLAGKAGGKNVRLLEADLLLRDNRQTAEITAKQISRATGLPLLEYVSEDREGAT
ncbi:hypothetical protein [Eikenella halliae]|uniref:Uncharacterized protein n=1 Tax=Eikenella halliae TaxID=1795832 RepID=A0A1B6VZ27_9NEIS|nr:hypothetical protein [Eikenella halliae]OAM43439.1 hypothetical protein A7Q00_05955 [Eikenella halliae]